ncbi:MAG: 2-hydroxychromene-2-carboxylate isomerase [Polyangiaceae bacterium]
MSPLLFLFDYVSPYSYLAATQMPPLAARHGRDVVPVPIVFGALLTTHGTRGPAEVPAKRAYLFRDILRIARALGVPLQPPATHPFNPLVALRATAMVDAPEARWKLTDALFRAAWTQSRRVDEGDVVRDVATEVGLDGASLVAAAASPEAKSRLRASTDDAIAAGVFGVPTVRADGELFWGVDSLPHLEALLASGSTIAPELVLRWQSVKPSVARKGGE